MNCALHPQVAAKVVCSRCDQPLCDSCAQRLDGKPFCPSCLERLQRRRAERPGGAVGAFAAGGSPSAGPAPSASRAPMPGAHCRNHASNPAADRCAGCFEAFCANCLVEIQGQQYCASCKTLVLRGQPVIAEAATMPCPEAGEALKYAIIGLFCFGIVLEPMAIKKALNARKMIELNPRLTGSGKATAALVIAIIGLFLWVLGIVGRFARRS